MPFKSQAQEKYFNANRAKLEAEGVDVDEWNSSSKGLALPKKVKKKVIPDEYGPTTKAYYLRTRRG